MPYDTTQNRAAKLIGIDGSRLSRLRQDGTLDGTWRRKGNRYYFDVEKLRAALENNLAPENRGRRGKKPGEKIKTESDKRQTIKKSGISDEAKTMGYSKARELNEAYKAALKKLEYEERSGKLVSREIVEKQAFDAANATKEACLAIPDRVAPLVAAESDAFQCKQIILKEINYILQEIGEKVRIK